MTTTEHDTVAGNDRLEQYDAQIREDNLIGQWSFEPLLNASIGGPNPAGVGHVWPWSTTRARLQEAAEILGPSGWGRTNLTFLNPGIKQGPPGSTHSLAAGIQIMRAGETNWSHRHTMSALRFVIDGNPESYTVVDGEELSMDTFDLLITPRFSWHDHHNPTEQEVVWLDVLDLGLTLSLKQAIFEPFGDESQPRRSTVADSQGLRMKALRPTWEHARATRLPVRYPWAEVLGILQSYGDSSGDPYDGLSLRYTNPVTGGSTMPTMDCWIQQFVPGFDGLRHRRTSSSVGYVVEGSGTVEIGDMRFSVTAGDTFAIPNYTWHRVINDSDSVLRIFSVHDIPVVETLGLFYEEPVPIVGAQVPPAVPGIPKSPTHRIDAMLDRDETRGDEKR